MSGATRDRCGSNHSIDHHRSKTKFPMVHTHAVTHMYLHYITFLRASLADASHRLGYSPQRYFPVCSEHGPWRRVEGALNTTPVCWHGKASHHFPSQIGKSAFLFGGATKSEDLMPRVKLHMHVR